MCLHQLGLLALYLWSSATALKPLMLDDGPLCTTSQEHTPDEVFAILGMLILCLAWNQLGTNCEMLYLSCFSSCC